MNFFRKPSFFSAGTVLALGLATGLVGAACGGELAVFERYPLISAPSMPTPPVIDGDLTEAEWQTAAVLGPLSTWPSGVSDEARQTVYVGYDADHLYLGFRIRRPDAAVTPQMPTKTGRVDDWESGDMVEIALDVDHDGADYFGFALYPNGAFADGVGAPGMNSHWDADWRQAASLTDTGWQGEMAIPFSSLGLSGPPSPGTFWGFDFIDNQRTPAKRVMMSGYRGGTWHHLENLGHLRFGAPGEPAVRYRRFEGVSPDRTLAEFEIVNPADVSATLDAKLELMRRKAGSGVGGKSFYDQVESGADTAYAEGKSEFEKSTELGELVDEALSHYERVDGGLVTDSLTVPAGQRRTLGMLRSAGDGEMLLRHEVRNAGGELLAGMVRLVKVEPPLSLSIEPYWLRRQAMDVAVDLSGVDVPDGAVLEVSLYPQGNPASALARSEVSVRPLIRDASLTLSTSDTAPGGYRVEAVMRDAAGKELARNDADLVRPEDPVWLGNDLGKSLPEPWTPVRVVSDGVVEVWGRTYDLTTVLPRSVTSAGKELLAAPVRLTARAGGAELPWRVSSLKQRSLGEQRVVFDAVVDIPGGRIEGSITLEFDGLLWYDLKLVPVSGKLALDSLALELELNPDHAALLDFHDFLHDPLITTEPPVPSKFDPAQAGRLVEASIPFSPYIWMGDEQGGLAFVAEAPVDWRNDTPGGVIDILPPSQDRSSALMKVKMIDHPAELARPMRLQFGLQATPIRPMPDEDVVHAVQFGEPEVDAAVYRKLADAGARTMIFHSRWKGKTVSGQPAWGGWPSKPEDPVRRHQVEEAVAQAHAAGLTVSLYTGWGVLSDSDEWRLFGHEMVRKPLENAGYGTYRQSAGINGVYADYMTWAHAELMRAYDNDGVFWDSTSNLTASIDIGTGTGWVDDEGRLHPAFPVLGTRELFKRIYTLSHGELKSGGKVINFGGSIWTINAFADIFHRGEGKPMHVKRLRDAWNPLEEFRASYDSRKIGLPFLAMNKNFKDLPMKVNQHTAVTLLHGTICKDFGTFLHRPGQTYYGTNDQPAPHLWQARQWLPQDERTRWYPYYGDEQPVTSAPDTLLSSAFVSGDGRRALIVVSNIERDAIRDAKIDLNLPLLGFSGDTQLQAEDALTGEPVKVQGGSIRVDIQPERYRLLKLWTKR